MGSSASASAEAEANTKLRTSKIRIIPYIALPGLNPTVPLRGHGLRECHTPPESIVN